MAPNELVGMAPGIIGQCVGWHFLVTMIDARPGESYMRRNNYMDSLVAALTQAIRQFISLFR